jgi:hypothetical protein
MKDWMKEVLRILAILIGVLIEMGIVEKPQLNKIQDDVEHVSH